MESSGKRYLVPGLAWLAALVFLAGYEVWAGQTGNYTLSQWVWAHDMAYWWFRWVVLVGIGVLMVHFFWRIRKKR